MLAWEYAGHDIDSKKLFNRRRTWSTLLHGRAMRIQYYATTLWLYDDRVGIFPRPAPRSICIRHRSERDRPGYFYLRWQGKKEAALVQPIVWVFQRPTSAPEAGYILQHRGKGGWGWGKGVRQRHLGSITPGRQHVYLPTTGCY